MGLRLRNMLANPGVALTWWDEAAWAERLHDSQNPSRRLCSDPSGVLKSDEGGSVENCVAKRVPLGG
jgi:hypothetical protein